MRLSSRQPGFMIVGLLLLGLGGGCTSLINFDFPQQDAADTIVEDLGMDLDARQDAKEDVGEVRDPDVVGEDVVEMDVAQEDSAIDTAPDPDLAVDDVAVEDVVVEDIAAEDIAAEDVAAEDVALEDPIEEDVAIEDLALEDPAVEDVALEDPAVEDVAIEDLALEDPAVEDVALEDPAVEDVALEDPAVEDVAIEDAVVEDLATEEILNPCETQIAWLVGRMCGSDCSWTFTIIMKYDTFEIVGYEYFEGATLESLTEEQARDRSVHDTGYGTVGDTMLNAPTPSDEYVFYRAPMTIKGAAAVAARTGLTAFGGSIVYNGSGEVVFPESWRSPDEIGFDCPPAVESIPAQGYDLSDGSTLEPSEIRGALDLARGTGIPEAILRAGDLYNAVVLLYTPSMPRGTGQEYWVVMINGGTP